MSAVGGADGHHSAKHGLGGTSEPLHEICPYVKRDGGKDSPTFGEVRVV